ncbi:hypothetical protein NLG97_g5666 [Lecanicillium saksenae]|uniref:Uncharacterized protein n=1 Tax=Lecanicillium saksenae TaxID=468837 RepID=A0ACC1QRZ5_9HYPO|nr:hypothetical protein NLG97_g5666 [Lecanicillium saksenae]
MRTEETYRLFGELCLEDPSNDKLLMQRLQRLTPYFSELESRRVQMPLQWDVRAAFDAAAQKEVACWNVHGQKRDIRFLIPPDGPLDALLACHLHNPNFSVSDPYCQKGADCSNVSINQIMRAGFTPNKVLIYDHTFRREPVDLLAAYPPDVLKIHEDFTNELRRNMGAVVDVVWGAYVRKRMKKTHRLEEFPLWGRYDGISIFLEWEKASDTLQRFVLFVCHPEGMMYNDPQIAGKQQDLSLGIAAKLAKISIREGFYEHIYQPRDHKFLSGEDRIRRNELKQEALRQLENVAFANASRSTNARQKRNTIRFVDRKNLGEYPGIYRYFKDLEHTEAADNAEQVAGDADGELIALDKQLSTFTSAKGPEISIEVPTLFIHPEIDADSTAPRALKILASALAERDNGTRIPTEDAIGNV